MPAHDRLYEIDKERFISLWNNLTITQSEIAAEFLISNGVLTKLAKTWGLNVPRPVAKKTQKQKQYVPSQEEIKKACERIQEKKLKDFELRANKGTPQQRRARQIYSYNPSQRYFSSREGVD